MRTIVGVNHRQERSPMRGEKILSLDSIQFSNYSVPVEISIVRARSDNVSEESHPTTLIKQCWPIMGMEERLWTIETKENRSHDWWLQFMLSSMSLQAFISIIYCMLSLFDVGNTIMTIIKRSHALNKLLSVIILIQWDPQSSDLDRIWRPLYLLCIGRWKRISLRKKNCMRKSGLEHKSSDNRQLRLAATCLPRDVM